MINKLKKIDLVFLISYSQIQSKIIKKLIAI